MVTKGYTKLLAELEAGDEDAFEAIWILLRRDLRAM